MKGRSQCKVSKGYIKLDNTPRVAARILDAIKFLVLCFLIAMIIDKIGIWPIY
jgi:hypothetical protein